MKYTAHIRESDRREQSVEDHCRRTSMLAAQYGETIGLEKTAEAAGCLHDIGKLNSTFHSYIHGENSCKRGDIDHSFAGAKYLKELSQPSDDANMRKTLSLIGRVILSHHGLHDWVDEDGKDTYSCRTEKNLYYSEILSNFEASELSDEMDQKLEDAVCEVKKIRAELRKIAGDSKEQFAFYLGMLERLLQSILIDADRTDTADFMSDVRTEITFDTERLWEDMGMRLEAKLCAFSDRTDVISKQRQSISDRCAAFACQDVHICKLIVPTGGGKTLSSLRFAVKHVQEYHKKKIIYIAPFMSILEQNSDAINGKRSDNSEYFKAYMDQLTRWKDSAHSHPSVRAIHAYLAEKTLMQDLIDCHVLQVSAETGMLEEKVNIAGIVQQDAFVRFRVYGNNPETWLDKTLYDSFIAWNSDEMEARLPIQWV